MSIRINFNKIGHDIRKGFEHIPQEIAHVPNQLQRLGVDPHHLQDWIHHETQEVILSAADEVAEVAFKKSAAAANAAYQWLKALESRKPNLIDAINEVSIGVGFSIVNFSYKGFYTRAEGLCKLLVDQSNDFHMDRTGVRNLLVNTGPTEIGINISGELFTSLASASFSIQAPLLVAVELVDWALEETGVPEHA